MYGFNPLTPMDILPLPKSMLISMARKRQISLRSYPLEFRPTLKGKRNKLGLGGLPRLVPCPVSRLGIQSMSLGMIY